MLSTKTDFDNPVVSALRRLAIPSTYHINGLDAGSFFQADSSYFPTRSTAWLLGSHLGFWRTADRVSYGNLSQTQFLEKTKKRHEDKHLYHEKLNSFQKLKII